MFQVVYHAQMAQEAGVPVVFGFFDYPKKRLGFGPMMMLTGDVEADMTIIRSFYESVGGHAPEKTGPVQMLRGKRRK